MTAQNLTHDTFFNGKVTVRQHRSGYRYSIDAVLLAHHVRPGPGARVLDLGTGCGIIPIILAYRFPKAVFFGVEIQKDLAEIADMNVKENRMEKQISITHQDMKTLNQRQLKGAMDIVVSNPPYRRASSGRINPNEQRAVARHEIKAALPDVVAAAGRMLKTGGKFMIIYSAERLPELFSEMTSARIEPKYLRCIHSKETTGAKMALIEGMKRGNPGLKVGPPLVIYNQDGTYTAETATVFD